MSRQYPNKRRRSTQVTTKEAWMSEDNVIKKCPDQLCLYLLKLLKTDYESFKDILRNKPHVLKLVCRYINDKEPALLPAVPEQLCPYLLQLRSCDNKTFNEMMKGNPRLVDVFQKYIKRLQ